MVVGVRRGHGRGRAFCKSIRGSTWSSVFIVGAGAPGGLRLPWEKAERGKRGGDDCAEEAKRSDDFDGLAHNSFSPLQTEPRDGAARIALFSRSLAFSRRVVRIFGCRNLPGTVYGQADPFGVTHWSVIVAAGNTQTDPETASAALAQLCQTYWPPLYTYVRSRGYSVHDAQDLNAGFFRLFDRAQNPSAGDRQMGKFRSFLLASLKHFLHARERRADPQTGRRARIYSIRRKPCGRGGITLPDPLFFGHQRAPRRQALRDDLG